MEKEDPTDGEIYSDSSRSSFEFLQPATNYITSYITVTSHRGHIAMQYNLKIKVPPSTVVLIT